MSKPITATAVLLLMEEGQNSPFDDPIAKYVQELGWTQNSDGKMPRITLRHLLTHTSGMGEQRRRGESRGARCPTWCRPLPQSRLR